LGWLIAIIIQICYFQLWSYKQFIVLNWACPILTFGGEDERQSNSSLCPTFKFEKIKTALIGLQFSSLFIPLDKLEEVLGILIPQFSSIVLRLILFKVIAPFGWKLLFDRLTYLIKFQRITLNSEYGKNDHIIAMSHQNLMDKREFSVSHEGNEHYWMWMKFNRVECKILVHQNLNRCIGGSFRPVGL